MKKFIITEEEKKEILGMYITKKLIAEQNWTQKDIDKYAKRAKEYREIARKTTNQNYKENYTNSAKDLENKVKVAKENLAKVAREKVEKERLAREKVEKEKVTNDQVKNNPATNVKTNDTDCKKDTPYNVVTKAGLNWKETRQKWIDAKCNGTTPCILGDATTNINLRNAVCDGWRPGNPKPGTVSTTGTTEVTGATETQVSTGTTNQDIRQNPYYKMAEKLVAEYYSDLDNYTTEEIIKNLNDRTINYKENESFYAELNPNLVPFMKQVIQDKTNGKINFGLK
jgi:hypothetical protein